MGSLHVLYKSQTSKPDPILGFGKCFHWHSFSSNSQCGLVVTMLAWKARDPGLIPGGGILRLK